MMGMFGISTVALQEGGVASGKNSLRVAKQAWARCPLQAQG